MKVLIETSARHAHITKETLEILFGAGYELTKKKDLSQPGQFACEERITVTGPKNKFEGVSILGPTRPADQVELSATDARSIGVQAVIRESGDLSGTPGCVLTGPKGEVTISEGVIVAKRHIHLVPATAKEWGVENGQIINLEVDSEARSALLGDVVVRVREDFADAVHIDTDESNAVSAVPGMTGKIIL
ncbi:MAG: phosphate propanoyltransferase [Oscillospiraceae bacterium]|nr:phosphate propanoyltransferase [Oscillospiraceae bacterium]